MLDMYMCIYVYISKYKQYIKETEVGSKQSNNIIPVYNYTMRKSS